ncbi:peptidyl-tRNA hydrolase [Cryptosporangium japonicum]|uniref:Peptidyl-tRNA hydrolase n=1 Tax=Cryptosporangium japonicum TaxID=80872 RepID=A0ABP3EVP5_9ACTN
MEPERVLPLVVRVEKTAPPARTDALEAAARAVLLMVTTDDPEWRDAVDAWAGNRIRKVVRRARGAEWRRALALPGVTVTSGSAEVRVYPPIPLDEWPRDLARLQVSGTELDDPAPPPAPPDGTPLVLLAPDVEMTAGKAMAQAGHAAQLGLWSLAPPVAASWAAAGFPLAVRVATVPQWAAADGPVVHDAGFTEVAPGSATAAFSWNSADRSLA